MILVNIIIIISFIEKMSPKALELFEKESDFMDIKGKFNLFSFLIIYFNVSFFCE